MVFPANGTHFRGCNLTKCRGACPHAQTKGVGALITGGNGGLDSRPRNSLSTRVRTFSSRVARGERNGAASRVQDEPGNVIETHEQAGEFKEWCVSCLHLRTGRLLSIATPRVAAHAALYWGRRWPRHGRLRRCSCGRCRVGSGLARDQHESEDCKCKRKNDQARTFHRFWPVEAHNSKWR